MLSFIKSLFSKKSVIPLPTPIDESPVDGMPSIPERHVRLYSPLSQEIYKDVPLDVFCEVQINTNGLQESNHFLLSLWNEMNQELHPANSEYIPWFYNPSIISTGNKGKLIRLGEIHTSSGNFHLMLMMKDKNSIKSIQAYNQALSKDDCKRLIEELSRKAKRNIDDLSVFVTSVRLECESGNIPPICSYSGKNFYLRSEEDGAHIDITLRAIDFIEAKQGMMRRLDELCAFLSVETNLYFTVKDKVELFENKVQKPNVANSNSTYR